MMEFFKTIGRSCEGWPNITFWTPSKCIALAIRFLTPSLLSAINGKMVMMIHTNWNIGYSWSGFSCFFWLVSFLHAQRGLFSRHSCWLALFDKWHCYCFFKKSKLAFLVSLLQPWTTAISKKMSDKAINYTKYHKYHFFDVTGMW